MLKNIHPENVHYQEAFHRRRPAVKGFRLLPLFKIANLTMKQINPGDYKNVMSCVSADKNDAIGLAV